MLRVSGDDIDIAKVEELVAQRGLKDSWDAARALR
jgi:hypothetical protein